MHPLKPFRFQVRRNVTDVSYHIAQYTNIIQELREEINRLRHRINNPTTSAGRKSHIADIQSVQCKAMRIRIKLRTQKYLCEHYTHADIQSVQCKPMRIRFKLRTTK